MHIRALPPVGGEDAAAAIGVEGIVHQHDHFGLGLNTEQGVEIAAHAIGAVVTIDQYKAHRMASGGPLSKDAREEISRVSSVEGHIGE